MARHPRPICSLLTLLVLSLFLAACTSPSPATPVVAISGPIVDATTNQVVAADVYEDGKGQCAVISRLISASSPLSGASRCRIRHSTSDLATPRAARLAGS